MGSQIRFFKGINKTFLTEALKANETYESYWTLLPQYGPTELDPDCLPWRYYSDKDFRRDAYDGLNGILLVCKQGILDENGKQVSIHII
ncbi:UNVERIFIED_CONTAM: Heph [Trichonephila clavipes]